MNYKIIYELQSCLRALSQRGREDVNFKLIFPRKKEKDLFQERRKAQGN